LETIALLNNIDGVALSIAVASLAGIGGYKLKEVLS